ncbi:septum formation initiator family protein [Frankia sp. Mgl5]|uniref:FtsB family cell division protein n=1 Tax=Frankia sp. Mgl5 TaxID=2933793 RepID=UPI00200CA469|nr:septum formation initiator family protein [Frankia sp. Mgl5]MCK9931585.1 septum formation initiator family protein [Frankia sp. Mgl5]
MPVRRTALTTRATLLAVVICVLVLTLAYPLRLYLQQQAKISELTRANAQRQTRVDDLRAEVARYDDPLWVADEARRRLHFVLPGEKSYLMPTAPHPTVEPGADAAGGSGDQSWYGRLWSQLDKPPATPTPAPPS